METPYLHVRVASGTVFHSAKNKSLLSSSGIFHGSQTCQSHIFFKFPILISVPAQYACQYYEQTRNTSEYCLRRKETKKALKPQNRKPALLLNCFLLYPRVPQLLNCPCISSFLAPVSAFKPCTSRKRYA